MSSESRPSARDLLIGGLIALDEVLAADTESSDALTTALRFLPVTAVQSVLASIDHDPVTNLGYGLDGDSVRGLGIVVERATSTQADLLDAAQLQAFFDLWARLSDGGGPWSEDTGDQGYGEDQSLRARRIDITVRHPTQDRYVVLGLSHRRRPANGTSAVDDEVHQWVRKLHPGGDRWQPLPAVSRSALECGDRVVAELLDELEHDGPAAERYGVLGCAPPTTVTDPTLTLPVALRRLGDVAGLELMRIVAAGEFDGRQFLPMDEREVQGRLTAVLLDGRNTGLLTRTASGWRCHLSDGPSPEVIDPIGSLAGAAEAYWGDRWRQWCYEERRMLLDRNHSVLVDSWRSPVTEPIPEIPMTQTGEILRTLGDNGTAVVVLGGRGSSGKSVIAGQVARRLTEHGTGSAGVPWNVAVLHVGSPRLPEVDELATMGRAALAMTGVPRGRRLLVLEDLLPVGEGDVDRILPEVAASLDCSVLGVLRYESNALSEWATDTVAVVTSVAGESLRVFAQAVSAAKIIPGLTGAMAADVVARTNGDIRGVVDALIDAAANASAERGRRELREAFAELPSAERHQVAGAAARSMLRCEVAERHLHGVSDETRRRFSIQRGHRPEHWRIISSRTCNEILEAYAHSDGTDEVPDRQASLIALGGRALSTALLNGDFEILYLVRGARLAGDTVWDSVLREADKQGEFERWMTHASLADQAALLRVAGTALGFNLLPALLKIFAASLPAKSADVGKSVLSDVMYVLVKHRDLLSDDDLQKGAGWAAKAFEVRLEHVVGPYGRSDLFRIERQMVQLREPVTDKVISERGAEILRDLDVNRVLDYITVRRVERLIRQATPDGIALPVDYEAGVENLLNSKPNPSRGVDLYLAWLTLRMHFQRESSEWQEVIDDHHEPISRAVRRSDARDLRLALTELFDYNPPFCTRLLNTLEHLDSGVRTVIQSQALPAEAANLLNTIQRIHGITAFRIINEQNTDRPHRGLARSLAVRIKNGRDAKAAGMLLSVTHLIEERYRFEDERFAHVFADELGVDWVLDRVGDDPRMSTRYYLVKGVWEAAVDYRNDVMGKALESISSDIARFLRPWSPQLAVLLCSDPEFGTAAIAALKPQVSADRLAEAMVQAPTADAQVHFHRLARALYPDLAQRYLKEFGQDIINPRIIASSPDALAQWCQEVTRTLSVAGLRDAGTEVLAVVEKAVKGNNWAERLRRLRSPGQTASTLRVLTKLDASHRSARDVVSRLDRPASGNRVRTGAINDETLLDQQVRRALFNDPLDAIELMTAVENVNPGAGKRLLQNAARNRRRWKVFTTDLQHLQDPVTQHLAVWHLAQLDIIPDRPFSDWTLGAYHHWLANAPRVASPRRAADLVRIFLLWGRSDWTTSVIAQLAVDRIADRLRYARPDDLAAAHRLIGALTLAGTRDPAARIVKAVTDLDPVTVMARMSLRDACLLVESVVRHQAIAGRPLLRGLATRTADALRQPLVFDEMSHWVEIGWSSHLLHREGISLEIPEFPSHRPNMALPFHSGWALAQLPESLAWVRDAKSQCLELIRHRPPARPFELFAALVVAAAARQDLAFVLGDDIERIGALVKGLSPRNLSVLLSYAGVNEQMDAFLDAHRGAVLSVIDDPIKRYYSAVGALRRHFLGNPAADEVQRAG